MEETLFYVIGIALVVAALTVSALGLRFEAFPPARVALVGIVTVFVMLVGGTTTFAVLSAREEQEHREAEEEAEAAAEQKGAEEPAGEKATRLELSSPAGTELVFDKEKLKASAGPVEIAFTNNSAELPHNVFIEQDDEVLAESETVTGERTSVSEELESGEYVFFCAVPGHREAGMEGALIVK